MFSAVHPYSLSIFKLQLIKSKDVEPMNTYYTNINTMEVQITFLLSKYSNLVK